MIVDDTVNKNNLPLMSFENTTSSQHSTKNEKKLMQNDVKLFAQLYIATQDGGGDIEELFKHETRSSFKKFRNPIRKQSKYVTMYASH